MSHTDTQTRKPMKVEVKWVKHLDPSKYSGIASGACIIGNYVAVVGESVAMGKPYVVLLGKSDGNVVREWAGKIGGFLDGLGVFTYCVSTNERLYTVGWTSSKKGLIYMFDSNLNVLASIKSKNSIYTSLGYDGRALYIGGATYMDVDGDSEKEMVWLIERREPSTLSPTASRTIHLDSWRSGAINGIGVEPSTGRVWARGSYQDSSDIRHSLILVLDSELRSVKVIDYPEVSVEFIGELHGMAFDGKGHVYVSGSNGIAKFNADGDLVALNKDIRAGDIVYDCNHLYVFGANEAGGRLKRILYVYDADLNPVEEYVLSENVETDSHFHTGMPVLDGKNVYVAGIENTLGKFINVYFLLIACGDSDNHGQDKAGEG